MTKSTTGLDAALYDYILETTLREPKVLARLRRETDSHPRAGMQISPDQGQLLGLLVELTGAQRIVEVGTFTGYSSLAMALALPDDGEIVCCDVSEEYTAVARRYWAEAGVADRITLRLGPAAGTLDSLIGEGRSGAFDMAFIDADKENYQTYFERCLTLVRPGGLIAVDNVLWDGRVLDPADETADTRAIRAFNSGLKDDDRVTLAMLSVADGVTLARKR
ncbi:MAG: SAM-dependent methyltransferase [Rhodospirillales bacterium CG15_BIG_FIL_POST_REV_8_21_14_020_66_15]|nr:MAG: SAM-dependent methyltransferase [Rhodospirillales bacterium CG15_BIG_FIL_POST_REV_8_21_14_020_66_15]